jgi:hypothetical protein
MTTHRRLSLIAETPVEVVTRTAEAVGALGGTEFEFGFDAADRELAPGEEPRPDERVTWSVRAVVRRKVAGRRPTFTTYRAERTTPNATTGQARAMADACIELLEKLGVNVVVIDNAIPDEPAHPSA